MISLIELRTVVAANAAKDIEYLFALKGIDGLIEEYGPLKLVSGGVARILCQTSGILQEFIIDLNERDKA